MGESKVLRVYIGKICNIADVSWVGGILVLVVLILGLEILAF